MFLKATNEQLSRIEEILKQLDQTPPDQSHSDRRRNARINIHTNLAALVLAHGGSIPVKLFTRNISVSGIGFVSRRFCRIGEYLALTFELPDQPPKLVLAHVTFGRYIRAGLYEAGAEFIECIAGSVEKDIPRHWLRRHETSDDAAKKEKPKSEKSAPAKDDAVAENATAEKDDSSKN